MLSVPRVHGHKRLDDDAMADSGINDRLVKLRPLIDQTCLSSSASAILLSAIFSVEYLISRNYYITWRPLSNR